MAGQCLLNDRKINRELGTKLFHVAVPHLLTCWNNLEHARLPLASHLVVGEAQHGAVVHLAGRRKGQDGSGSVGHKLFQDAKVVRFLHRGLIDGPVAGVECPVELEVGGVGGHVADDLDILQGGHAHRLGPRMRANGRI